MSKKIKQILNQINSEITKARVMLELDKPKTEIDNQLKKLVKSISKIEEQI